MTPPCFYNGECQEGPNCPLCTRVSVRRSNGGFVAHVVGDDDRAECGYKPSSPRGHLIRNRGHWKRGKWMTVDDYINSNMRHCPKCLAKIKKEFSP